MLGTELQLSTNDVLARIISRGREEWDRREGACPDDPCRIALLSEQLNRLLYPLGRNERPIQGLPWSHGSLSIESEIAGGGLQVLPIVDDRLVISGHIVQMPQARWTCDLQAEGRVTSRGVAEITSLDELRQRYRLEAQSAREMTISFLDEGVDRMCGMNGTLEGNYRVREAPIEASEPMRRP